MPIEDYAPSSDLVICPDMEPLRTKRSFSQSTNPSRDQAALVGRGEDAWEIVIVDWKYDVRRMGDVCSYDQSEFVWGGKITEPVSS